MLYIVLVGLIATLAEGGTIERVERVETNSWYLAMNLNPEDGHKMGYGTGWTEDIFVGTYADALTKDYLNRVIWRK